MKKPRHHLTILGKTTDNGLTQKQIVGTKKEIADDLRTLASAVEGAMGGNTYKTLSFWLSSAAEELIKGRLIGLERTTTKH